MRIAAIPAGWLHHWAADGLIQHGHHRTVMDLVIDGSHGEGGGQILRTTLSLAAITGRTVRIENIRANRKNPGLAAQHLTCVRAVGALCRAAVEGADLGSQKLSFAPQNPVQAGDYVFDVAAAREGGSAGSTPLVLQAVLIPLALADGRSRITLRGGTHVPLSPTYDYLANVWVPTLAAMGVRAELSLRRSGWYPAGRGEVEASIAGGGRPRLPAPLRAEQRGPLRRIRGRALAANLPSHIPERMVNHATTALSPLNVPVEIEAVCTTAACAGAGLCLAAEYEHSVAGFDALGQRGKPSERVADEAVAALCRHFRSGAAVEGHLADQLILPCAVGPAESVFTAESVSLHLMTNAWVVEQFGLADVGIETRPDATGRITIRPRL